MSKRAPISESPAAYAARDGAEDIGFAVELKFLVRLGRDDLDDPAIRPFVPNLPAELRDSMTRSEIQLRRYHWEAIAQALDTLPNVNSLTSHQIQEKGLGHTDYWGTHWIVYKANSAVPPYVSYQNGDPDLPLLDSTFPNYGKYVWIPVEVCSPILHWSARARDHASGEGALQVLRTVLQTIGSSKKCGGDGVVLANYSTETHVHVGRVDGRFFSLVTMKRLATLAWLSEPILRGVKNPDSPNFEHLYTWSSPLRKYSRLGMALRDQAEARSVSDADGDGDMLQTSDSREFNDFIGGINRALDAKRATSTTTAAATMGSSHENGDVPTADFIDRLDRQALQTIWRAGSHQELGKMLVGPGRQHRRLGFNFHSLSLSLEQCEEGAGVGAAATATATATSPRTVEFRFLEGFIDTQVVPAWVRLCGEMVGLAVEEPGDDGRFHTVVAALLLASSDDGSPLDVKFRAFVDEMGEGRIPGSVWDPLQEVIRKNYPAHRTRQR